jgi:hypothetical protein
VSGLLSLPNVSNRPNAYLQAHTEIEKARHRIAYASATVCVTSAAQHNTAHSIDAKVPSM